MPISSKPTVPQELQETVIDCLCDDYVTLKSCALVSRAWWPRCRYHLRSTLTLADSKSLEVAKALFSDPAVAFIVRKLSIGATQSYPHWSPAHLSIIAPLVHLTHLSIAFQLMTRLAIDATFPAQIPTLTHLTLNKAMFPSFDTFEAFLNRFPNVQSLNLRLIYWSRAITSSQYLAQSQSSPGFLKLSTLRISAMDDPGIIDIANCVIARSLRIQTLILVVLKYRPCPFLIRPTLENDALNYLLRCAAPSLHAMEMRAFPPHLLSDGRIALAEQAIASDPERFAKLKRITFAQSEDMCFVDTDTLAIRVGNVAPRLVQRYHVTTTMKAEVPQEPPWA